MFGQIVKSVLVQLIAHYAVKGIDSSIEKVTNTKEKKRVCSGSCCDE